MAEKQTKRQRVHQRVDPAGYAKCALRSGIFGRQKRNINRLCPPAFGGGYTLTDDMGNEMQDGIAYDTKDIAINAASELWPEGKKVQNGWRIPVN
jgi:hypothetical protein